MKSHCQKTVLVLALAAAYAGPAFAQESVNLDSVVVSGFGRGEMRQVEAISAREMKELAPGSSPLVAVSRLPSVNFQSADAFGAYEWSTRISLRGFNQNQLGFTLDDIPLGDMSYGNHNGLHISRAISSENIRSAVVAQGTGSLDTASSSNLGGTIQFYSSDPTDRFGGQAALAFGSYKDQHVFARLDSGQTGFGKFYASVSDQRSDKWKGSGQQRQDQVNLKYVISNAEHYKFSAFANTSHRQEIDYQDLSLEMINRLGYGADNFYPNFAAAVNASNTLCGNNGSTYVSQCDDAYYAGSGLRNDELYGATLDARLGDGAGVKTTVYRHHDRGMGLWYTPYVASPNGTPISLRTTEYAISRNGLLSALTYEVGMNEIKGGFWLERNTFDQARRFYSVSASSIPSPYDFPSNPFATQWQYEFKTDTTQFFLQDTLKLSDTLSASAGFKSLHVTNKAALEVGDPTAHPSGEITASKGFLPQLGLNWKLTKTDELFAAYAENMRAFQAAGTGLSPFSTTTPGFQAIQGSLRPETSKTLEGGWRFASPAYEGVLSAYIVNFHDRLLAIQQGAGIVGNPNVLANVGRAQMTGLEAALSFKLAREWSWYNGLSLAKAEYKDDYTSNGVVFHTSGKTMVDVPETMFKSVLGYAQGPVFGNLGLDYMGKRYYTYLNDSPVDGRTLLNASVGYRQAKLGGLSDATIQFNVTNLTNKKYVSTLGSNGFVASDPNGTAQTLLAGAPREWFVTLSAKF